MTSRGSTTRGTDHAGTGTDRETGDDRRGRSWRRTEGGRRDLQMGSSRRDRGVSEVLGGMLLFSLLITALGLYQVTVVPVHNEGVELQHNDAVREELATVRNALVDAGLHGTGRSVTVSTGTEYPVRPVSTNPPSPDGALRTESVGDAVRLQGLTASDPEAAEYWSTRDWAFDSEHLAYRPDYNYYADPPTVRYEPTVLYSDFRDGQVLESDQRLVDGDRLDVVLLAGTLGTTSGRATVDVRPDSPATHGIRVTAGEDATLEVRTRLSEDRWQALLAEEPRASLADYDPGDPALATIALTPGEYTLRVGRAGLGTATTQTPAYVVPLGETERTVPGGLKTDLAVRVLDRFGNPVSGVTVHGEDGATETTDSDGVATVGYVAPTVGTEGTPTVWFGDTDRSAVPAHQRVDYRFDLTGTDATTGTEGPGANYINPSTGFTLTAASMDGTSTDTVRVTFTNRGDEKRVVTAARLNYYHTSPPGNGASERRTVTGVTTPLVDGRMGVGEDFQPATDEFVADGGDELTTSLTFDGPGNGPGLVDEGDYFVVTLTFADGNSRVYFVTP